MTTTETTEYAYIGVAKCGCVQAACTDEPGREKQTLNAVKRFMRWGHVERVLRIDGLMRFCYERRHDPGECPHPGACPAGRKEV